MTIMARTFFSLSRESKQMIDLFSLFLQGTHKDKLKERNIQILSTEDLTQKWMVKDLGNYGTFLPNKDTWQAALCVLS